MKVAIISTGDNISIHGIRIISSYLKKYGYKVRLIFLPTYKKEYSEQTLKDLKSLLQNSNLIGISCTSYSLNKTIQVIKCLRNLKIPIIWGGIYATFNPEQCLKYADFVCVGEGEEAILELIEKLAKKEDATKIKNLWTKKNGKIYKNEVRPLIQNLDDLPFADYELENQWILEKDKLINLCEKHFGDGEFNRPNFPYYKSKKKASRFLLIHTSRGCPYSCSFCCNYNLKKIYQNKGVFVRKRSVNNVIKELVELKQKLPSIDFIWFTDDSFFIRSIEEISLFSKEYKKKIKLPFMCYADPLTFNEEKLKLFLDAGLEKIQMGIQTGSEEFNRNIYNRFITNKDVIRTAKILNKYKNRMIPPEYQLIIANPYETQKDVLATIDLLEKLPKPFFCQPFSLVFFPGTQLFNKALKDGIIKSQTDSCYNLNYIDYMKNLTIKNTNTLYLNFILLMMWGDATRLAYGVLPKPLLKLFLNKIAVRFFTRFKFLTQLIIKLLSSSQKIIIFLNKNRILLLKKLKYTKLF